jgi:hypothetical protein
MITSFQIFSNPSFTYQLTIRLYIVLFTEKSVVKQINKQKYDPIYYATRRCLYSGLFNDAISNKEYIASNDRMSNEWWMEKDIEGI